MTGGKCSIDQDCVLPHQKDIEDAQKMQELLVTDLKRKRDTLVTRWQNEEATFEQNFDSKASGIESRFMESLEGEGDRKSQKHLFKNLFKCWTDKLLARKCTYFCDDNRAASKCACDDIARMEYCKYGGHGWDAEFDLQSVHEELVKMFEFEQDSSLKRREKLCKNTHIIETILTLRTKELERIKLVLEPNVCCPAGSVHAGNCRGRKDCNA